MSSGAEGLPKRAEMTQVVSDDVDKEIHINITKPLFFFNNNLGSD
jgi:hypothetical protein